MNKMLLAVLLLLCAACTDMEQTASHPAVNASAFIYDSKAKPVESAAFVYDPNAPVLRASKFITTAN